VYWRSQTPATGWLRKQLEQASPDLLRAMGQDFAEALMGAVADALCGAGYGERTPERSTFATASASERGTPRVGTIELAIPKLRQGSYLPDWMLQPRRRAEQAFVSVNDAYLAGVSTRRVEKPRAAARRRADVEEPGLAAAAPTSSASSPTEPRSFAGRRSARRAARRVASRRPLT